MEKLKLIKRLWLHVADKISLVNNKIILFITYYLVLSPIGLIRRIGNRDPLNLKLQPCESYKIRSLPRITKKDFERPY